MIFQDLNHRTLRGKSQVILIQSVVILQDELARIVNGSVRCHIHNKVLVAWVEETGRQFDQVGLARNGRVGHRCVDGCIAEPTLDTHTGRIVGVADGPEEVYCVFVID